MTIVSYIAERYTITLALFRLTFYNPYTTKLTKNVSSTTPHSMQFSRE